MNCVEIAKDPYSKPEYKSKQVSVTLDWKRYSLLKRIKSSYQTTHKDFLVNCFDRWLVENINAFPDDERQDILDMVKNKFSDV